MAKKDILLKDLKAKVAIDRILFPLTSLVFVIIGIVTLIKLPQSAIWIIPVAGGVADFLAGLFVVRHLKRLIADMENEQNTANAPQSTENE